MVPLQCCPDYIQKFNLNIFWSGTDRLWPRNSYDFFTLYTSLIFQNIILAFMGQMSKQNNYTIKINQWEISATVKHFFLLFAIHSFTNFIKGDQRALFSLGGYFCRRSEFIWIPGVNSLDSEGRPDFKLPTVIVFILPGFTFKLVPSAKREKKD